MLLQVLNFLESDYVIQFTYNHMQALYVKSTAEIMSSQYVLSNRREIQATEVSTEALA